MALQSSPFPNCCVSGLHSVGWVLILPCFWSLNSIIALCKSTTLEQEQRLEQECYLHPLKLFFGFIFLLVLFIITSPLALVGFLLWAPLQGCRRPFYYLRATPCSPEKEIHKGFELEGRASFCFATANLCLLPEGLARFNNLCNTQRRASAIAQRIVEGVCRPNIKIYVDSPSSCGTLSPSSSSLPAPNSRRDSSPERRSSADHHTDSTQRPVCVVNNPCDERGELLTDIPAPLLNSNQNSNQQDQAGHRSAPRAFFSQGLRQKDDVPWEVSSLFPANVDMLCLEEVFDKKAANKLTRTLKPVFGHILYDVGVYACQPPCKCTSFTFFNSGLFVASRFPFLEAKYHWFPNSKGEDALVAKGLLCVKVLVGQSQKQRKVVGYFNCTHLHAPEGEGEVRCVQLDMVTKWIRDFQEANKRPDEDVVFDVLCGDLNFDNCSPDDHLEQNHSLFEEYKDPCRAGPGKEKPWVIGTLLVQPTLYHEDVNTPENLQRTLEIDEQRKCYISPPVPAGGTVLNYPERGQPWIGRRIDYILFREGSVSKQCQTEVEEVTFITHLAGLTDHIPVGLRLNVTVASDHADE